MATRRTRRAGLPKPRIEDAHIRQAFDAIIERLEVLDGLRGDDLDKAVTWRDLHDSGFTIKNLGSGGAPIVTNTPGPGDGTPVPTAGPSQPPTSFTVTETWLALMLEWSVPGTNLEFVEVWRNSVDDLSTAVRIGTSPTNFYVDYVGGLASYYYWIRSVGTDGSYSAYFDPDPSTAIIEGTLGTTGVDPSDWEDQLNISANNLDALLASRIDLIDTPTTGLVDRITSAEGDIVSIDGRTATLEANYTTLLSDVNGNTSLINTNALAISTTQASVTNLGNSVSALDGRLTTAEDDIVSNASSILNLEASLGALDAAGGETWDFTNTADGWTVLNGTLTTAPTTIVLNQTATDPQFIGPTISLTGGIFTQVVARVRQTISGGGWDGRVYYKTAGHGFSGSFYKAIPDPSLPLSQWATLTWDMINLTAGGTDWEDNTITQIRIDLGATGAGRWEIDWVIIAKFSTTALSSAIDALDVRVTANEGIIGTEATKLAVLTSTVNDPDTGVEATAQAVTALTTTVGQNTQGIFDNAQLISALNSVVTNPDTGVVANANAITQLETEVSTLEGTTTSQASSITQLVSRLTGGFSSVVYPFDTAGVVFGSTVTAAEVQNYSIGGRSGVAARVVTSGNIQKTIDRSDGDYLYVDPYAVYEVKFRVYHDRPTNAGSFYFGVHAFTSDGGSTLQIIDAVNDGAVVSSSSNQYWLKFSFADHDEEWLDVTCYLLGDSVDPANCPDMVINGATTGFSGYGIIRDGMRTRSTAPYVRFRFLNNNDSPFYGDGTPTTVFFTNFTVQRIDTPANFLAVVQQETSVLTSSVGDINATYAVRAELTSGGDPYVAGFGLMADVINGTATSAFGIRTDKFFVANPANTLDQAFPFVVDTVDGVATVGVRGELIVDGTIRAASINAAGISADKINVTSLAAITGNMGFLGAAHISTRTVVTGTNPNGSPIYGADTSGFRTELQAGSSLPLWYGSGVKTTGNGLFYVTSTGDVVLKGVLEAGMIRQSFFTPAISNNAFRIAVDYPTGWAPGTATYTGKQAHLLPMKSMNDSYIPPAFPTALDFNYVINGTTISPDTYFSPPVRFYGPGYTGSSTLRYGRFGTLSEMFMVMYSVGVDGGIQGFPGAEDSSPITREGNRARITLQYRYDAEAYKDLAYQDMLSITPGQATTSGSQVLASRSSSWTTLDLRLKVTSIAYFSPYSSGSGGYQVVTTSILTAFSPNFGVSDASLQVATNGGPISGLPDFPIIS